MIALPIIGTSSTHPVNPGKIIAMGRNYLDHIAERDKVGIGSSFDDELPSEPILFPKTPNTLIGPEQPIVLPAFVHECGFERIRTHYEAELAFIIKHRCKDVPPEEAFDYILGFTCANDVSQRNIQGLDKSGWFRGKSLDTFCPVGPCVVPLEAVGDPQELRIQCRLNGETVQNGNTRDMIFKIPELLAYVSMNFTLEAGDLILTGTPAGVGEIVHGDVVEIEIENVGVLRNPVIDERM
ncbi:MAG: fumarylacetoacetate hydrolase family protein [Kiritimatiellae bacterium]|nr:fumarylacetoacetate hydrolase family protein [Kiritimatiellia bacterium]